TRPSRGRRAGRRALGRAGTRASAVPSGAPGSPVRACCLSSIYRRGISDRYMSTTAPAACPTEGAATAIGGFRGAAGPRVGRARGRLGLRSPRDEREDARPQGQPEVLLVVLGGSGAHLRGRLVDRDREQDRLTEFVGGWHPRLVLTARQHVPGDRPGRGQQFLG